MFNIRQKPSFHDPLDVHCSCFGVNKFVIFFISILSYVWQTTKSILSWSTGFWSRCSLANHYTTWERWNSAWNHSVLISTLHPSDVHRWIMPTPQVLHHLGGASVAEWFRRLVLKLFAPHRWGSNPMWGSCQLLPEGCWFTPRNNVFLQLWKLTAIYN